jgi:hypothetical protein
MKYTEEQIKRMEERLASYMADDRPVVNFSITGSLGNHMELLDRWPKCEDDYRTRMRHIIGGACR